MGNSLILPFTDSMNYACLFLSFGPIQRPKQLSRQGSSQQSVRKNGQAENYLVLDSSFYSKNEVQDQVGWAHQQQHLLTQIFEVNYAFLSEDWKQIRKFISHTNKIQMRVDVTSRIFISSYKQKFMNAGFLQNSIIRYFGFKKLSESVFMFIYSSCLLVFEHSSKRAQISQCLLTTLRLKKHNKLDQSSKLAFLMEIYQFKFLCKYKDISQFKKFLFTSQQCLNEVNVILSYSNFQQQVTCIFHFFKLIHNLSYQIFLMRSYLKFILSILINLKFYSMQNYILPKYATAKFQFSGHQLQLKDKVQVLMAASLSTSVTLAGFLSYALPDLGPPGCPQNKRKIKGPENFPSQSLFYNIYHQPWIDYLTSLLWQHKIGSVKKNEDTTCYTLKVDEEYYKQVKEQGDKYFIQKISEAEEQIQKKCQKQIRIFNFSPSQTETDPFKPQLNPVALISGSWYSEGDQWKVVNIFKGEMPTKQEFKQIDAIFMTGSAFSVNDNRPDVQNAIKTVKSYSLTNPKMKIIGFCFGHQAICKYSGCQISTHQIQYGLVQINLNKDVQFGELLHHLSPTLLFTQYHENSSIKCPENFTIFGTSSFCQNECMMSNNRQYLGFQFHPEYTLESDIAFGRKTEIYFQAQIFKDYWGKLEEEIKSEENVQLHRKSIESIRYFIRDFIDRK